MRRTLVIAIAAVCGGGVFTPTFAQKTAPVGVTRDTDRDGVPDTRDRCPGTPLGTRVDVNGCPIAATPVPRPSQPTTALTPPKPVTSSIATQAAPPLPGPPAAGAQPTSGPPASRAAPPGAGAPAGTQTSANPSATGAPAAAAQPATNAPPTAGRPPAAAPTVAPTASQTTDVDPTLTEGFMMPVWDAARGSSAVDFARTFVVRLDSTIVALVERFRGVAGQPVSGATDPTNLSNREKQRWRYCRNIKADMQTYSDDVPLLQGNLPAQPLQNAWADLGEKLSEVLQVLDGCEQVAYMIDTPDATTRFAPWESNYLTAARSFYAAWYTRLRALNDGNRNVARLLNMQLPADRRVTILPLPATAPTLGGAPR